MTHHAKGLQLIFLQFLQRTQEEILLLSLPEEEGGRGEGGREKGGGEGEIKGEEKGKRRLRLRLEQVGLQTLRQRSFGAATNSSVSDLQFDPRLEGLRPPIPPYHFI